MPEICTGFLYKHTETIEYVLKLGYFLRKTQPPRANNLRLLGSRMRNFKVWFLNGSNIQGDFQFCIGADLLANLYWANLKEGSSYFLDIIFSSLLFVLFLGDFCLQKQSCKLYNRKYMIALTQATNTEIFAFIAVRAFKLLNRKVLFINRKDNGNSLKVVYFLRE